MACRDAETIRKLDAERKKSRLQRHLGALDRKGVANPKPKRPKKKTRKPQRQPSPPAFARPNYWEYIASEQWKAIVGAVKRCCGYRCEICGSNYGLQVHHKTYERLGREEMDDLQLLCGDCHANQHEHEKRGAVDRLTKEFRVMVRDTL